MSIVATFKSQRISGWTRLESGRPTIIDHHEMETEQKLTERKAQTTMRGTSQGRLQDVGCYEWKITGRAQRNMQEDGGSGNGPTLPRISKNKKYIYIYIGITSYKITIILITFNQEMYYTNILSYLFYR